MSLARCHAAPSRKVLSGVCISTRRGLLFIPQIKVGDSEQCRHKGKQTTLQAVWSWMGQGICSELVRGEGSNNH